jgi:hypothetical protein
LRAIKLEERLGNIKAARSLLGSAISLPLDRSWKVLMEGALLEARVANFSVARKVFKV